MFPIYPYINLNDLNLDYILKAIREMQTELNNFVSANAIKYADPIQWNITKQYEKNTVVIDPQTGIAYLSTDAVPSGISVYNTNYWTEIFSLKAFFEGLNNNFTMSVDNDTLTATIPLNVGSWVIWNYTLYKVISPIVAGDQYVIDSNIKRITMENYIGLLANLTTDNKDSIVDAINSIVSNIGDLANLTTNDKTSIVNAINELNTEMAFVFMKAPLPLHMNMIANYWYDGNNTGLQGGCYVGNDQVVFYCADAVSDTGTLTCINVKTWSIVWSYPLTLYHGNGMAYNPTNNRLYVAGCYAVADPATLIPEVFKINLSNPSSIEETITAPMGLFSIAYDQDNNIFYGCTRVASSLYKFNGEFESIEETYTLPYYSTASNQGYNIVKDGIAYITYFSPEFVLGIDIEEGKIVYENQIPHIVNGYRWLKEPEAITYDFDNDRFIGFFNTWRTFNPNYSGVASIVEMGLYKPVLEVLYKGHYSETMPNNIINVVTDLGGVQPVHYRPSDPLESLQDAFILYQYMQYRYSIIQVTGNCTHVYIDRFDGLIRGVGSGSSWGSCINNGTHNVILINITFTGENTIPGDSITGGIITCYGAKTTLQNCTIAALTNGVVSYAYGHTFFGNNNTFTGTGKKFFVNTNGTLEMSPAYSLANNGVGAYGLSDFSLTIPYNLKGYRLLLFNGAVSATPTTFPTDIIENSQRLQVMYVDNIFEISPLDSANIVEVPVLAHVGTSLRWAQLKLDKTNKTVYLDSNITWNDTIAGTNGTLASGTFIFWLT